MQRMTRASVQDGVTPSRVPLVPQTKPWAKYVDSQFPKNCNLTDGKRGVSPEGTSYCLEEVPGPQGWEGTPAEPHRISVTG